MELNREQIIKALECCTSGINHKGDIPCLDCPYDECNIVGGTSERQITGTCSSWLKKDTLSLIKELIEENERLENALIEQSAKNVMLCGEVKHARSDTVRKMQERLTKEFNRMHITNFITVELRQWIIDQIAKEMLEDEK